MLYTKRMYNEFSFPHVFLSYLMNFVISFHSITLFLYIYVKYDTLRKSSISVIQKIAIFHVFRTITLYMCTASANLFFTSLLKKIQQVLSLCVYAFSK